MNELATSRLVVVGQIAFTRQQGKPVYVEERFGRSCSDGQPYVREVVAGPEWQALDCGWVKGASLIVVEHPAPRWTRQPGAEEKAAALAKVVEIASSPDAGGWLVRTGETFRGSPSDVTRLFLRCSQGLAQINVYLFPA